MTQSHLPRPAPLALTIWELDCLDQLRHGALSRDVPAPTRSYLLSQGYLERLKGGVIVTPRGRTALLCQRP